MHGRAVQAHGITTKLIPLIFVMFTFLYVFEYTTVEISIIQPEDMFMGGTLIFGSLIFIYEAFQSRSNTGQSVLWALMIILAIIGFIFGGAIILDIYDPIGNTGFIAFILDAVLFAMLVLFGVGAVVEIVQSRRMHLRV